MATDRLFNQTQGDSLISAVTALQSKGFTAAQITTLLSTLSGTNTALDAIRAAIASTSRGSVVSVTPAQSSGQAVGAVRVDNVDFSLFSLPTVARTQAALSSVADILAGQDAEKTATGNPATITAKAAPVRALSVQIEAVQAGSGNPSPTNIRPISGWTAATVTRTGKNLFDGIFTQGTINGNGEDAATEAARYRTNYIRVDAGKSYIFARTPAGWGATAFLYSASKTFISSSAWRKGVALIPPDGCAYVRLVIDHDPAGFSYQIEEGTEETEFEAYQGQSATVSFGDAGTVYGGTLDVLSGTLTVTHKLLSLTGSETVTATAVSGKWNIAQTVYIGPSPEYTEVPNAICSHFSIVSRKVAAEGSLHYVMGFSTPNSRYLLTDYPAASTTEVKNWLSAQNSAGKPVQIVFPLATPLTYTLTPVQLSTLPGTNAVYADCGPLTVRYIADISSEIADLRAKINALGGA